VDAPSFSVTDALCGTLMLPLLRRLDHGKQHNNQETIDALTVQFKLTNGR